MSGLLGLATFTSELLWIRENIAELLGQQSSTRLYSAIQYWLKTNLVGLDFNEEVAGEPLDGDVTNPAIETYSAFSSHTHTDPRNMTTATVREIRNMDEFIDIYIILKRLHISNRLATVDIFHNPDHVLLRYWLVREPHEVSLYDTVQERIKEPAQTAIAET